jgi:GSCFA family.
MIGSCFTENIAEKLCSYKFSVLQNPSGILFNPVSVCNTIQSIIHNKQINESDLFELNESWHSWQHHSRFSGITAKDALHKINSSTQQAHVFLKQTHYLFITLGSAWVYQLTGKAANAATATIAANNHKAPAGWFEKKLLSPDEITALLHTTLQQLQVFNPSIKIIFTISPVRHLREGVINNNRSKAALIQAVHAVTEYNPDTYYFPAYEIVIDDLRDYRFYAEDLVHPNYAATAYVWDKLVDACMSDETKSLIKQIAEINLAFRHKPFNPQTQQHQSFLKTYLAKTQSLQALYPFLDFEKELNYFAE